MRNRRKWKILTFFSQLIRKPLFLLPLLKEKVIWCGSSVGRSFSKRRQEFQKNKIPMNDSDIGIEQDKCWCGSSVGRAKD